MQKAIYAFALILCSAGIVSANPGDTTWVQAHNTIQLTNYGSFDAPIAFPSGSVSYRKIYMEFTLGEYACPTGTQYCHQWDYTVQNILMTPAGDTIELSRFITPYANSGVPGFPSTWKYRYIFDVSDYYTLLKNNAALRIFYSGYSYGFTANVRFAFIEGSPERNVLGVTKLWGGSYTYGKATDPIDNYITSKSKTPPSGTQAAELKFTITGHGSDPVQQCCEFASHNYQVKVNGSTTDTKTIWRNDCGSNEIYPQGGTWIYERGNWCPGDIVNTNTHKLTGVTAGVPYTVDVDFDAYTNTAGNNYGSYTIEGNVIYYAAFNKATDASLEDIIAPSDFEGHFRENPSVGSPIITVRNTGGTAITSLQIKYGVKDSVAAVYNWSGSLAPLAGTQITLPELPALKNMSLSSATGNYQFAAQITAVNGAADNDVHNDTLRSFFTPAPTWPNVFVVYMKTNSQGTSGVGQNPSETSWKITDAANNIVASRMNADINTAYSDTVSLPKTGFYKLTVTDGSCDGLHWWVWDQNPQLGITAGNIIIRDASTGIPIPVRGNTYGGTYHDDFGCGFVQSFTGIGWPAGVPHTPLSGANATIVAYPNPARNTVHISLYGLHQVNGELSLVDAVGRVVLSQQTAAATTNMDVDHIAAGIYNVVYTDGAGIRIYSRIAISK